MRWLPAILIIGIAGIVTAVIGYILVLAVEPNTTVCYGTPTDGYCDTHAGHWAIVGLIGGLIIGAVVATAFVRRRNIDHAV
jgi:hypothetical protein